MAQMPGDADLPAFAMANEARGSSREVTRTVGRIGLLLHCGGEDPSRRVAQLSHSIKVATVAGGGGD